MGWGLEYSRDLFDAAGRYKVDDILDAILALGRLAVDVDGAQETIL